MDASKRKPLVALVLLVGLPLVGCTQQSDIEDHRHDSPLAPEQIQVHTPSIDEMVAKGNHDAEMIMKHLRQRDEYEQLQAEAISMMGDCLRTDGELYESNHCDARHAAWAKREKAWERREKAIEVIDQQDLDENLRKLYKEEGWPAPNQKK